MVCGRGRPCDSFQGSGIREQEGVGPDVVIECVGAPETGPTAVNLVRRGGRAVIMGIFSRPCELNFNNPVFPEKEIIGSICYVDEFETVLRSLADGRLSGAGLITGRIAPDDLLEKGFKELIQNKERHVKILVKPN